MPDTILEARKVAIKRDDGHLIVEDVSFAIRAGDVAVLSGKSGSGKTTVLKALAHLIKYDGQILFHDSPPTSYGVPAYRTRVLYVPQRPSLLPGTPFDFVNTVAGFTARSSKSSAGVDKQRPVEVAKKWGIEDEIWHRSWANLSGGEAQRVSLAIAVGLGAAEMLLLDEPTSALDAETSELVERDLLQEVKSTHSHLQALVWITHSKEQGQRVGSRFLEVADGSLREVHEQRAPEV